MHEHLGLGSLHMVVHPPWGSWGVHSPNAPGPFRQDKNRPQQEVCLGWLGQLAFFVDAKGAPKLVITLFHCVISQRVSKQGLPAVRVEECIFTTAHVNACMLRGALSRWEQQLLVFTKCKDFSLPGDRSFGGGWRGGGCVQWTLRGHFDRLTPSTAKTQTKEVAKSLRKTPPARKTPPLFFGAWWFSPQAVEVFNTTPFGEASGRRANAVGLHPRPGRLVGVRHAPGASAAQGAGGAAVGAPGGHLQQRLGLASAPGGFGGGGGGGWGDLKNQIKPPNRGWKI